MRPPSLLINHTPPPHAQQSTGGGGGGGGEVIVKDVVNHQVGDDSSPSSSSSSTKMLPLAEREINGSHLIISPRNETNETSDSVLAKYLAKSQFTDVYDVEHDLGKGRFAVVKRCRCRKTNVQFAAKVLRKARLHLSREAVIQEVYIHHRACRLHSRIARLFQVFEAPRDLILVLEYAVGGELWQALAHRGCGLYEPVVRRVLVQLLDVLSHLHTNGIIHCDINPHNILLARPYYDHPDFQPDIRLCDFGLARSVTAGQELRDIRGTLDYVAPEVILFDPIGPWSDVWSVGILAYVLLSGYSPFAGSTKEETLMNISRASITPSDAGDNGGDNCGLFPDDDVLPEESSSTGQDSDEDSNCSSGVKTDDSATNNNWATRGARDFITRILARNPKQRPTAGECLRLPWLRDVSINPDNSEQQQTTVPPQVA